MVNAVKRGDNDMLLGKAREAGHRGDCRIRVARRAFALMKPRYASSIVNDWEARLSLPQSATPEDARHALESNDSALIRWNLPG